ncbi:MAG: heme NO-binding domain-containing protein [Aquirhabdus sp.]
MKGIVFNLLEEVVTLHHGSDVWEQILDQADVSGIYTSLGSYPDEEMSRLVKSTANHLAIQSNDVILWFGRNAMPFLAERYPHFFTAPSTRSFLMSLNSIIHPEVRKIYSGVMVPIFDFHDAEDGGLLMGYRSERKLCALAQGFSEGAADYYGNVLVFKHLTCMHHGDDKCLFHISFLKTS